MASAIFYSYDRFITEPDLACRDETQPAVQRHRHRPELRALREGSLVGIVGNPGCLGAGRALPIGFVFFWKGEESYGRGLIRNCLLEGPPCVVVDGSDDVSRRLLG